VNSPHARSVRIPSKYSDLSTLHQLFIIVRLHQPRVSTIPSLEDAKKTESGKGWRYIRAGYLDQDHRVSSSTRCAILIYIPIGTLGLMLYATASCGVVYFLKDMDWVH
jgi:hypothetical protein